MPTLKTLFQTRRADMLLTGIVFVWGLNFVIMKDALSDLNPLTFNALRFMTGSPAIGLLAVRDHTLLRVPRREWPWILAATLGSTVAYQVLFLSGLDRTTSTNSALLTATMPTWTGVITMLLGMVQVRRKLLVGIAITLLGVALVVLSRAEDGLSLSHGDVVGSALVLASAVALALGNLLRENVIDRVGAMRMSLWSYWLTALAMMMIASPDLVTLTPADFPTGVVPNILFSGWVAGVGGFLVVNYALAQIGANRTASYFNFQPIVAAAAGIAFLGEPFSGWLLVGGALTLGGVVIVRGNIYARKRPAQL